MQLEGHLFQKQKQQSSQGWLLPRLSALSHVLIEWNGHEAAKPPTFCFAHLFDLFCACLSTAFYFVLNWNKDFAGRSKVRFVQLFSIGKTTVYILKGFDLYLLLNSQPLLACVQSQLLQIHYIYFILNLTNLPRKGNNFFFFIKMNIDAQSLKINDLELAK